MASNTRSKRAPESPRTGQSPDRKYDPASTVLWWESHGKPSAMAVSKALGMPYYAALATLRDIPGYWDTKVSERNPKQLARRAAIVTWWRDQGKPRLLDVSRKFGLTRERVRQILCNESDYDRCTQGDRQQRIRTVLELHPEWTAARVAKETGRSQSTVQNLARNLGHKFPETVRPEYKPRGRVLKILNLHNKGLRRSEIAKRLGIANCIVFKTLDRFAKRRPEFLTVPIVDGRSFRYAVRVKPSRRR